MQEVRGWDQDMGRGALPGYGADTGGDTGQEHGQRHGCARRGARSVYAQQEGDRLRRVHHGRDAVVAKPEPAEGGARAEREAVLVQHLALVNVDQHAAHRLVLVGAQAEVVDRHELLFLGGHGHDIGGHGAI